MREPSLPVLPETLEFALEVCGFDPEAVARLTTEATRHEGDWQAAAEGEAASYFLMTPGHLAVFKETVEGEVSGWGTFEVLAGQEGAAARATIEQREARGDRYTYDVIRTAEGVAAEIKGKRNLVAHDWIWRFPIQPRDWTEELDETTVSFQLYFVEEPVEVEAGRFHGCLRLSTVNENGSSAHTYHPQAGLILSEFTDVEGTPGRRELFAMLRV
ncbi:hypothetical protein D3C86_990730 [compost metagenome]